MRYRQAGCDCGKNDEGRFWVHLIGDDGVAEVVITCPGCGAISWWEIARGEAAGKLAVQRPSEGL